MYKRQYLAVLFSDADVDVALAEMRRYSDMAHVVSTNLPAEAATRLAEALSGSTVQTGVADEDSTYTA